MVSHNSMNELGRTPAAGGSSGSGVIKAAESNGTSGKSSSTGIMKAGSKLSSALGTIQNRSDLISFAKNTPGKTPVQMSDIILQDVKVGEQTVAVNVYGSIYAARVHLRDKDYWHGIQGKFVL